ncbi:hypothetical protein Tco_1036926 [Tanacetum coccineum]
MLFLALEEVEELLDEGLLGALGALGDESLCLGDEVLVFGNGSSSGCHSGLWWLIEDEEDGDVDFPKSVQAFWVRIAEASRFDIRREDHHFVQKKWECRMVGNRESGKVGMIWSFSVLEVCKSTKIPFVCEYCLTSEWDYEDLTELLERECDEFILNYEGDKNDVGVISLKSDLTIKV